jgi:hypothetical protein
MQSNILSDFISALLIPGNDAASGNGDGALPGTSADRNRFDPDPELP